MKKVYLPPKWDMPYVLWPDEYVMGVTTNCVEIMNLSMHVHRWIELPADR